MMGERTVLQKALFYTFNLDRHVPVDHLLRSIDRFVDLSGVRQAEATAAKTMIARTAERLELEPARLAADTGYGSAEMLAWLVEERGIEPSSRCLYESARKDGSLSRAEFTYDHVGDAYTCPWGKLLTTRGTLVNGGATLIYRASPFDCSACNL